jgi:hypothetical protein
LAKVAFRLHESSWLLVCVHLQVVRYPYLGFVVRVHFVEHIIIFDGEVAVVNLKLFSNQFGQLLAFYNGGVVRKVQNRSGTRIDELLLGLFLGSSVSVEVLHLFLHMLLVSHFIYSFPVVIERSLDVGQGSSPLKLPGIQLGNLLLTNVLDGVIHLLVDDLVVHGLHGYVAVDVKVRA